MQKNPHAGHRAKAKAKFLANGFPKGTPDHEILEFLLYYAIAQKDTNTIAHNLIERFGSLSGVFNAPINDLKKIGGISEHSAILIKLIPEIGRAYNDDMISNASVLHSTEEVGTYLLSRYAYYGTEEVFSMISMNNKGKVLSFDLLSKGSVASVNVDMRKIVEVVLRTNATSVIIAHNHPGGVAVPSPADIDITLTIKNALSPLQVNLIDHIILSTNDYSSLASTENFKNLFK